MLMGKIVKNLYNLEIMSDCKELRVIRRLDYQKKVVNLEIL